MKTIQEFFKEHAELRVLAVTFVTTIALLLSLFIFVKTLSEIKSYHYIGKQNLGYNTLPVTGNGEVTAVPNIASFTVSVIEKGKTVTEAQTKATEKNNKIVAFLKEKGIADKDVQTSNYSVNPQYEYTTCPANIPCPPSNPTISGYEVNQTLSVKVRKTDDAGAILSGVGSLGASQVSGISFTVDDQDTLKQQARDKAIADARTQAEEIAEKLGVRLGEVISFNEVTPMPYTGYGIGGDSASMKAMVAPTVPTGESKITSQVMITYEIK